MSEPPRLFFLQPVTTNVKIKPPPSKKQLALFFLAVNSKNLDNLRNIYLQKLLDFMLKPIDKSADICIIET